MVLGSLALWQQHKFIAKMECFVLCILVLGHLRIGIGRLWLTPFVHVHAAARFSLIMV